MPEEHPTERIVERPTTTIVERKRGGAGVIIAIVFVALLAVIAYFLAVENKNRETDAIVEAAQSVGDAAQRAGDAAQEAVDDRRTP